MKISKIISLKINFINLGKIFEILIPIQLHSYFQPTEFQFYLFYSLLRLYYSNNKNVNPKQKFIILICNSLVKFILILSMLSKLTISHVMFTFIL